MVAEKRSVCAGGLSELYEAQERAVLQEYQSILQKILERVNKKAADDGAPGALPGPALAERGRGGALPVCMAGCSGTLVLECDEAREVVCYGKV